MRRVGRSQEGASADALTEAAQRWLGADTARATDMRCGVPCCAALRGGRPCLVPALQESHQLVAQQAAAVRGNDKLGNAVAARERAADEVARDIEMAKVEAERLLAEQVTWDLEVRAACLPLRLGARGNELAKRGAGPRQWGRLLRRERCTLAGADLQR